MKKWHIFVVLCISVIFLVSCGKSGQPSGAPRNPFLGGIHGLVVEFEKDAPPPEVTDFNFPFRVILDIKNEGEAEVKHNEIRIGLKGISAVDFSVEDRELEDSVRLLADQNLLPKRRDPDGDLIEGTTTFVTIPPLSEDEFYARRVTGNTPFTFRADICYPYKTRANAHLCILKNLLDLRDDKVCNPNEAKTVFSSGSPVQVTNFRQNVAGVDKSDNTDVIRFSFDVVHRGNGDIYNIIQETGNAPGICPRSDTSNRLRYEDTVQVTVNSGVDLFIERVLLCGFESNLNYGPVRLVDGSRTVTCTLKLDRNRPNNDFESIVDIEVDFNYDQSISKEVLVRHIESQI